MPVYYLFVVETLCKYTGLAVVTSYGLSSAMDIMYTTLHSSLPFLVLGLGADDAFVIVGEFQHQMSAIPKGTISSKLCGTREYPFLSPV